MVSSCRSCNSGGVGRTSPKSSGRSGSRRVPSQSGRAYGLIVVVVVAMVVVDVVVLVVVDVVVEAGTAVCDVDVSETWSPAMVEHAETMTRAAASGLLPFRLMPSDGICARSSECSPT